MRERRKRKQLRVTPEDVFATKAAISVKIGINLNSRIDNMDRLDRAMDKWKKETKGQTIVVVGNDDRLVKVNYKSNPIGRSLNPRYVPNKLIIF